MIAWRVRVSRARDMIDVSFVVRPYCYCGRSCSVDAVSYCVLTSISFGDVVLISGYPSLSDAKSADATHASASSKTIIPTITAALSRLPATLEFEPSVLARLLRHGAAATIVVKTPEVALTRLMDLQRSGVADGDGFKVFINMYDRRMVSFRSTFLSSTAPFNDCMLEAVADQLREVLKLTQSQLFDLNAVCVLRTPL